MKSRQLDTHNRAQVLLVPPCWQWVAEGTHVCNRLKDLLKPYIKDVRHVGSTSGLQISARPVLDIAVGLSSLAHSAAVEALLCDAGYYPVIGKTCGTVQCYMAPKGVRQRLFLLQYEGQAWRALINFRNYLCFDRAMAKRYESLKRSLAARYPQDAQQYECAKAEMMQYILRKATVWSYLGKVVTMQVDRPIGYVHQKDTYTLHYPINYGYLPDVLGGDGEELDVYLMGVTTPVTSYTGRIIGIVHRENDVEDKLVMAPTARIFTQDQIARAVQFQERYYVTHIEARYEKSCGALIWRRRHGCYEFLLLRQKRSGSWSFPKGHMEAGETELICAAREVQEECGMSLHPQPGFRRKLQYTLGNRLHKQVVLFLSRQSGPVRIDGCEITDYRWVNAKEAKELIPGSCVALMWCATAYLREQLRIQKFPRTVKSEKQS